MVDSDAWLVFFFRSVLGLEIEQEGGREERQQKIEEIVERKEKCKEKGREEEGNGSKSIATTSTAT